MTAQTILPANSVVDSGFNVANSVRMNRASTDYLKRTPSAGNRRTWTFSTWVKRSSLTGNQDLITSGTASAVVSYIYFYSANGIFAFEEYASGYQLNIKSTAYLKDLSAWYNLIVAVDTTQGTASNRIKMYINGTQVTSFSASAYPSEDFECNINSNTLHNIGCEQNGTNCIDGYLAETVFIDGLQLGADSFGEFDSDSGIWKPIDVSDLTFGSQGWYLDYEDSSALGNDVSGNNNDYTSVNLTAIDQSTDTCTNNFATLNPLDVYASKTGVLSEGNLKLTATNSQLHTAVGTIAPSSGKWYLEVELDAKSGSNNSNVGISDLARDDKSNMPSKLAWGYGYNPDGTKQNSGSDSSYGDSYAANDILGVAMDLDNGAVYFSKNGTFQASGDPTSGASKTNAAFTWTPDASMTWAPYVADNTSGVAFTWITNFGNPIVTGTDQTDGKSRGSFEYAVPSGYLSLCTKNLGSNG